MAVPQFDLKELFGCHAKIVADHDPDHPAVGDHKGRGFKVVFQGFKKRGDTGFEIIETFSFGGVKRVYLFSPLQKQLRAGLLDMIKGFSVPGSHIDFI